VRSVLGKWVEHAPLSFENDSKSIESSYELKEGILSFNLDVKEIRVPTTIDPWIALVPEITSYDDLADPADSVWVGPIGYELIGTGLENAYNRVQIDYDALGNIYLSQIPCLFYESPSEFGFDDFYPVGRFTHKFNPQGDLLFTVDQGTEFAVCTDISVNKATQEFYSLTQFSDMVYQGADGTTTDSLSLDEFPENLGEIISVQYDHCQDKLLLGLGADNDLFGSFIATTGGTYTGVLDYSFAYDLSLSLPDALPFNDNIDVLIDPYGGDYYMLFLLRTFSGFTEDRALLRTDPVNVDPIWQTNGEFLYLTELSVHSVGIIQSNLGRMHYESLAVGRTSVYGMNGSNLIQFDKADGSIINELEIYPFFQNLGRAEGIDVDMCGNVYVGAENEIQIFDSLLSPISTIQLDGMPQDIEVYGNRIYVAQDFNIESIDIPEEISPWQFTQEPDSCDLCIGAASISFCELGDPPGGITVEWLSNGDTGLSTTGLCAGWNQVQINENKGCYTNQYIDSVFVESAPADLCAIQVNIDDQTICEGECLTIEAVVTGQLLEPVTFEWSTGVSGVESQIEVCPNATTTYSVTAQDANGDIATDEMILTVVPVQEVFLGNDTSICETGSFELDAGNATNIGASYSWQDGSVGPTYNVSSSDEYWVDAIIDGCTASDTIQIQFGSLMVDLGNDITVCSIDGLVLDAGDEGSQYTWQDGSSGQFYSPQSPGIFSVTVSNGTCSGADSITISTSEIEAFFDFSDTIQCEIGPVEFTDQSQSTTNSINEWSWYFGDGTLSAGTNPIHLYESVGEYSVTLTVSDNFGCTDTYTDNVQVEVFPSPEALFGVTPATPVTFQNVEFTDESIGAISWNWDLGDGTTSINQNTAHSYENPGVYSIELIVENEFCSDKFEVLLRVGEELIIHVPNSFTPNEDGINDLFGPVISGADLAGFEMLIFNRWGELIFETSDISRRWNGSRSGNASNDASGYYVPNGVYIWQITVKENLSPEKKQLFGTVTIMR